LLAAGGHVDALVDPDVLGLAIYIGNFGIFDEVFGDAENREHLVGQYSAGFDRSDGAVFFGPDLIIVVSGIGLPAVKILPAVKAPLDRPARALGDQSRAIVAAHVPGRLTPAAETGPLIRGVDGDLVHGDAPEPGADHLFAHLGPLLLDPDLRVFAVPAKHAAGTFRADPGMLTAHIFKLQDHVGLGQSFFHITELVHIEGAFVEIIGARVVFGVG